MGKERNQKISTSFLLIPPSFWSEPRDVEAWLRALAILAKSGNSNKEIGETINN